MEDSDKDFIEFELVDEPELPDQQEPDKTPLREPSPPQLAAMRMHRRDLST